MAYFAFISERSMNAFASPRENLSGIHDIKGLLARRSNLQNPFTVKAAACSGREIRDLGLTTPDKPVARRPSTVPAESGSRGTNERANERGACLALHRLTLLRMLLFVPLVSS